MIKNRLKTTTVGSQKFSKIAQYDGTQKISLIVANITSIKTKFEKKMEKETENVEKIRKKFAEENSKNCKNLQYLKMRFGAKIGCILTAHSLLYPSIIYQNFSKCTDRTPEGPVTHPDLSKLGEARLLNYFLQPLEAISNFVRIFSRIEDGSLFWTPKSANLRKKCQNINTLFGYLLRFGKINFTHADNMLRFLALSLYFLLRQISRVEFIYFLTPTPTAFIPPEIIGTLCTPVKNWPIWFLFESEFSLDVEDRQIELIEFLDVSDPDDIIEIPF